MKLLLLLIFLLASQLVFSQYSVNPSVQKEYRKTFKKLDKKFKRAGNQEFKTGVGLLYREKTDTLNREDIDHELDNIILEDIDPPSGKSDPEVLTEEESVRRYGPFPLYCDCSFNKDTLIITSGYFVFSGYAVTAKVYSNYANATYTAIEKEDKSFKRTLEEEKQIEITIPAKIDFLTLDRNPNLNIQEIIGHIGITTPGYYSYINAFGFKTGYIYMRKIIQFYFRCNTKSKPEN